MSQNYQTASIWTEIFWVQYWRSVVPSFLPSVWHEDGQMLLYLVISNGECILYALVVKIYIENSWGEIYGQNVLNSDLCFFPTQSLTCRDKF